MPCDLFLSFSNLLHSRAFGEVQHGDSPQYMLLRLAPSRTRCGLGRGSNSFFGFEDRRYDEQRHDLRQHRRLRRITVSQTIAKHHKLLEGVRPMARTCPDRSREPPARFGIPKWDVLPHAMCAA